MVVMGDYEGLGGSGRGCQWVGGVKLALNPHIHHVLYLLSKNAHPTAPFSNETKCCFHSSGNLSSTLIQEGDSGIVGSASMSLMQWRMVQTVARSSNHVSQSFSAIAFSFFRSSITSSRYTALRGLRTEWVMGLYKVIPRKGRGGGITDSRQAVGALLLFSYRVLPITFIALLH